MDTDTSAPGESDDLADAVNYRMISKKILVLAERSQFRLVEHFAE
jgi:dihydroneopterin aldolase